jgi:hypothetical protein
MDKARDFRQPRRMAEDLKRSVEHLQSPVCPNCHLIMKWYRSIKLAEIPATIAHFFHCENCQRIVETHTVLRADESKPPPKLSRPSDRLSPAA